MLDAAELVELGKYGGSVASRRVGTWSSGGRSPRRRASRLTTFQSPYSPNIDGEGGSGRPAAHAARLT